MPTARLPILLPGGRLKREDKGKFNVLTRTVRLPTRGVWYVWVKATHEGQFPAVLTWDLDGVQPLYSSRSQLQIPPHTRRAWHSYTRFADTGAKHGVGFPMQVHVDRPGRHTLTIRILTDDDPVEVERIALTLHFSAKPTRDGRTLDHSTDPGRGRASFKPIGRTVRGFDPRRASPAVRAKGRAYYVDSARGDDARDGRAPGRAWKTFAKASGRTYAPGDAILLRRGGRWRESLAPKGDGTADRWITIGAYGSGPRPRIVGADGPAVSLKQQSFWAIQDLETSCDPDRNPNVGAIFVVSGPGPQPRGIRVSNCIAFDTAGTGIAVGTDWQPDGAGRIGNGYDGVLIENCLSFANSGSGIDVFGADQNGCRNSVIRDCTVYGNDGMAGMWIFSGQNGLIDRCVGYNNAVYNIWTWNAINVTIRGCEAFRGRPPGAPADSGGFDIDWGSQACTVEDCYSHHNKGTGFLLMGSGHRKYRGFPMESRYNLCRNNVSESDGNGIFLFSTFEHGRVHDNLLIGDRRDRQVIEFWGISPGARNFPDGTEIFNNRVAARNGAYPIQFDYPDAREFVRNLSMDHNRYDLRGAGRGFARLGWEKRAGAIPTLAAFRRTLAMEPHGTTHRDRPGPGRSVLPVAAWLAARRRCLAETGAEAHGIPMAPGFPAESGGRGRRRT